MREREVLDGKYMPQVSVILPTYNRATLLPRAIRSVLEQSYTDLELIVVDDGSDDDTADVVGNIGDSRVRYLQLARNQGICAARNRGLHEAKGEFLAFQDSDDEWDREKLEKQIRFLEANPEADIVYCDMYRQRADGSVFYLRSPSIRKGMLINPETGYWQSYMLAMQPTLMRRECLQEERFDENMVSFEDLDLFLRLAQRHRFIHLKEPLVDYHQTFGNTANRSNGLKARWQLLKKYRRQLLVQNPGFLLTESTNILLRRSPKSVTQAHLTLLTESTQ